MDAETRDTRLLQTFAFLADTLVAEYHIVDLLQNLVDRCQELLDATDAGILLAGGDGHLEVVASTDERSQLIELMQLQPDGGPCVDCYLTGKPVSVPEISELHDVWPRFRDEALAQGFNAVHAVPLRLRDKTIGSLNLFRESSGALSELDSAASQALADVATIGILQERALRESDVLNYQLQRALDSRVIIEQAKGVLSYLKKIPADVAFELIRRFARENRRSIVDVAEQIVNRTLMI